jgi:hypothetical protein
VIDMDGEFWRALIVGTLGLIVVYAITCWIWPWAKCGGEYLGLHTCDAGRFYAGTRQKTWRDCRKCKGTGKRRRFGRTLWAVFITSKRKADGL